ncbi:hypothetical protein [Streptomyces sp. NPDC003023]
MSSLGYIETARPVQDIWSGSEAFRVRTVEHLGEECTGRLLTLGRGK